MQRDNQYTFKSRVRFSEVDHTKRITLPGIVNYFQDCSNFQSEELGLGVDHFAKYKRAWILSAWQVVIDRYPSLGEEISVSTWATEFNGLYGLRNFCMEDEGRQMTAYANSVWVYMDIEKGRPAKPGEDETKAYGEGEPLKMEYAPRKIALAKDAEPMDAFPVRKYHIDTNVQMALEVLKERMEVRQLRVEYKRSAVYGDVIYPRTAYEKDRTVVELCDEAGKPYAVVELK